MLCVVVLEVEDGDFSDLKGSALDVHSNETTSANFSSDFRQNALFSVVL